MDEVKKFEVGKIYYHRWITDSRLKTHWQVLKRTPCTITIQHDDEIKTCRIIKNMTEYTKIECVKPYGNYSLCPVLRASNLIGG